MQTLIHGLGSDNKMTPIPSDPTGGLKVIAGAVRSVSSATIANGASVSSVIDLNQTALIGFLMPAAWTSAALNIEVSSNNADWNVVGVYNSDQSVASTWASPVVGGAYSVDVMALLPWRYIRFRSGTSGSPINQGAARAINVITRALT